MQVLLYYLQQSSTTISCVFLPTKTKKKQRETLCLPLSIYELFDSNRIPFPDYGPLVPCYTCLYSPVLYDNMSYSYSSLILLVSNTIFSASLLYFKVIVGHFQYIMGSPSFIFLKIYVKDNIPIIVRTLVFLIPTQPWQIKRFY